MCPAEGHTCFAFVARRDGDPPGKRQMKSTDEENKQHSRKTIKAVFRRYNVLSSPEPDGKHLAFDALLDACEGEYLFLAAKASTHISSDAGN